MKDIKILGLELKYFIIVLVITVFATLTNILPKGMIGAFLFLMVVGELVNYIGDKTPIINKYFGGGPIVAIFFGSALVYYNLLPEDQIKSMVTFMKGGGFLDFYIAALITGSILGMNRKLLIKAAIRYLPCIIGAVAVSLVFVAIVAPVAGFTPSQAIAYVGIPIMGGGMGAGAVPIAGVFENALGIDKEEILSKLVPAVALGNALAIVFAGLLHRLGEKMPQLTGNGNLMISNDGSLNYQEKAARNETYIDYAHGIVFATTFFTVGAIISKMFKMIGIDIHTYAFMIISVAISKALGALPDFIEDACESWYKFVSKNFTAALLIGIGIAYTNLGQILDSLSFTYIILVISVVIGAIIGAGLLGKLVGFYPIEAAITAGLCMANMGGTGDVAVLTASKRMVLMPFAQISSRIGGAFIILLASFLVPIFF